jgi:hypothetical protein
MLSSSVQTIAPVELLYTFANVLKEAQEAKVSVDHLSRLFNK